MSFAGPGIYDPPELRHGCTQAIPPTPPGGALCPPSTLPRLILPEQWEKIIAGEHLTSIKVSEVTPPSASPPLHLPATPAGAPMPPATASPFGSAPEISLVGGLEPDGASTAITKEREVGGRNGAGLAGNWGREELGKSWRKLPQPACHGASRTRSARVSWLVGEPGEWSHTQEPQQRARMAAARGRAPTEAV